MRTVGIKDGHKVPDIVLIIEYDSKVLAQSLNYTRSMSFGLRLAVVVLFPVSSCSFLVCSFFLVVPLVVLSCLFCWHFLLSSLLFFSLLFSFLSSLP